MTKDCINSTVCMVRNILVLIVNYQTSLIVSYQQVLYATEENNSSEFLNLHWWSLILIGQVPK